MRHRWVLPLLLVSASGVLQAQVADSTYVRRIKQDVDSISRDYYRPAYVKRAQTRIKARSDSILHNKVDTVITTVVRVDTVYIKDTTVATAPPDTTTPKDTVTPGAPPGTVWTHPYPPPSNGALFAQFPKDTVQVVIPAPTRTINVQSLQAALDTAKNGDRLLIPANNRTDMLHVRPTARTSWVTIQGTDSTSVITTTVGGSESAVIVESKAHHVRFLGPLKITSSVPQANALYRSFNAETSLADVPHHIILDGVTIDPGKDKQARRCAWPDGAYMAIVNSRLLNCATTSGDAQAVIVLNGPGPYRFENNWLEGSHQCFLSGGGSPSIKNSIPSDIVFRGNTCFKPLWWHFTTYGQYSGYERQVKTIIETKNVRRLLVEYNILRNVWSDAQAGFCVLLKSEDQDGTAPWTQSVDITFRYNRCVNVTSGVNLAGRAGWAPVLPASRISLYDNAFDTLSTRDGEGIPWQLLGDATESVIMHNTTTSSFQNSMSFDGAPTVRTVFHANIVPHGAYGVKGSGTADGMGTITTFMPGGLFTNNIIVGGGACTQYPAGTLCTIPSPIPLASDGKPVGADLTKIPK